MPSEFNHIDDFFRRKEEEASADNSMQDRHWQQMKGLLVSPAPAAKIRTLNPKLLWQLLIGFSFIAVIGLLVWRNPGNEKPVQTANASTPSATSANENIQTKINDQMDAVAANTDSQQNKKPFVSSGDFRTNLNLPASTQNSYLNQPSNEIRSTDIFAVTPSKDIEFAAAQLVSFFKQLEKKEQQFIIDTKKDTTITCKEGTTIFIPANSFTNAKGIINGPVVFTVREFYEMADIIGNKLNTTSDAEQLVTGGMLNLDASFNGNIVSLKKDAALNVKMPTEKYDPAMQLFYGNCGGVTLNEASNVHMDRVMNDTCSPNGTNWAPAGQQQGYLDTRMIISVIDLLNDPRSVNKVKGKKIAKFIVSDNSPLSDEAVKAELQKRYGNLYDEIKVRRGWKAVEETKGNASQSESMPKSANMAGINALMVPNMEQDTIATILTNWKSFKNGLVGDSIRMTLGDAVNAGLISKEDAEKYRVQFKSRTGTDQLNEYMELNRNYSFNVSSLGWINCDKFLAYSKEELTNFVVDAGTDYNQTYFQTYIVFNKFNSVMSGNWYNGKIVFNNIPLNEKVSVVCVGIKDGKAIYSVKETIVSPTTLTGLQFAETTPADFREKMKMFGNVQKG